MCNERDEALICYVGSLCDLGPCSLFWHYMKTALLYNQLLNLGWTLLGFAPVLTYWVLHYQPYYHAIALVLSFVPFLLPGRWLKKFKLSNNRRWYTKLGVRRAQDFTQNGALVNRLIRQQKPGYALLSSRRDVKKLKAQINMYEKYHLAAFVFFFLTMVLAFKDGAPGLGLWVLAANLIYNMYPILIQHYNKLRLPKGL